MLIFPAIDLYGGMAVRLLRGKYEDMTVYDREPLNTANKFAAAGARYVHMVDLEGARDGGTPNLAVVERIVRSCGLLVEIGGGVRDMDTIERYLGLGAWRVVLGTAALEGRLAEQAVAKYGEKIAVGADLRDGIVAVRGWRESSDVTGEAFFRQMSDIGVKTIICTDISRDGAMRGANRELYRSLSESFDVNIVASGGVSGMEDIAALGDMGLYGAIIGKAYYTGAIDLKAAIALAEGRQA